jgi:type I restriction enzyme S subunit
MISGSAQPQITRKSLNAFVIPLPPLDVQQEIVDEIEGYQKVIDGARQVVENYKPVIPIDPDWPLVKLGEVCEVKGGKRVPKGMSFSQEKTKYPYLRVTDFKNFGVDTTNLRFVDEKVFEKIKQYTISSEDVFISIAGTIGIVGTIDPELDGANLTENAAKIVIENKKEIDKHFLVYCLASTFVQQQIIKFTHAVGVPKLALFRIKDLIIPLASVEDQKLIVDGISKENQIINCNQLLIERFEAKIAARIQSVWGAG